jgi:hypothetical protein
VVALPQEHEGEAAHGMYLAKFKNGSNLDTPHLYEVSRSIVDKQGHTQSLSEKK